MSPGSPTFHHKRAKQKVKQKVAIFCLANGSGLPLFLVRIEKVVSVTNLILKVLKLYALVTTRSRTIVLVEFCTQI